MAGCAEEHHAHKVSLVETGDTAFTRGDRTQGIGNFLHVGGASNSTVRVGDVGPLTTMAKRVEGTHPEFLC